MKEYLREWIVWWLNTSRPVAFPPCTSVSVSKCPLFVGTPAVLDEAQPNLITSGKLPSPNKATL